MLYKFASVYRCLVALDDNTKTVTKFPMIPDQITATTGDAFAFDFNREIHYIEEDPTRRANKQQRVVLKVHYAVYPVILAPWGWLLGTLNVAYNTLFRALFLKTLKPKTWFEDVLARFGVVGVTKLVYQVEEYVGYDNLAYLALVAFLDRCAFADLPVFLLTTSFVHYARYVLTYYVRDDVVYGNFKRDALLFKSIALIQLAVLYLEPFYRDASAVSSHTPLDVLVDTVRRAVTSDPASVAMIVSGYTLSTLATKALGLDRTYFGVELGFCEPKWISDFPYNVIPHPMIASQILALLGLYKAEHMRTTYPWLLPTHIALYAVHMFQEMYDVHGSSVQRRTPHDLAATTTTTTIVRPQDMDWSYEVATCEPEFEGEWKGEWEPCHVVSMNDRVARIVCQDDMLEIEVPTKFVRPSGGSISTNDGRRSSRRRTPSKKKLMATATSTPSKTTPTRNGRRSKTPSRRRRRR